MNTEYIVSICTNYVDFVFEGRAEHNGTRRWWKNFLDDLKERGIQVEIDEWQKFLNDELKKWNAYNIVGSKNLIGFKSEEDFAFFLLRWS